MSFSRDNFMELYEAHADDIFRYCYYQLFDRERAKQATEKAFQAVWQESNGHDSPLDYPAVLYRKARDAMRHRRARLFSLARFSHAFSTLGKK